MLSQHTRDKSIPKPFYFLSYFLNHWRELWVIRIRNGNWVTFRLLYASIWHCEFRKKLATLGMDRNFGIHWISVLSVKAYYLRSPQTKPPAHCTAIQYTPTIYFMTVIVLCTVRFTCIFLTWCNKLK